MRALAVLALLLMMSAGWAAAETLRIATFNASLSRKGPGLLIRDLEKGKDRQIAAVLNIIATVKPDILLINELDHDRDGIALRLLNDALRAKGHGFAHHFSDLSNTGMPSGVDLNGDGEIGGPTDAFGFGTFRGQYGMALLSRFPIDTAALRSFRKLRWVDAPEATLPGTPAQPHYSKAASAVFRLSSKSHWDIPVTLPDQRRLHILASHPTPPVFDGPEDANGLRNRDEILLWARYLDGAALTDDAGRVEAFAGHHFAILGDLNADPFDGDGRHDGIAQLLAHPLLQDPKPASNGAVEAARTQGGSNARHRGPPDHDTADWRDDKGGPGNLRVDYVLPSKSLKVMGAGVFWPATDEDGHKLIRSSRSDKPVSSDHRLVWVDIALE